MKELDESIAWWNKELAANGYHEGSYGARHFKKITDRTAALEKENAQLRIDATVEEPPKSGVYVTRMSKKYYEMMGRLVTLEKENEALRQALEWYGDEKNYNVNTVKKFFENGTIYTFVSEAENDKGTRARETLQSIRNEGKG